MLPPRGADLHGDAFGLHATHPRGNQGRDIGVQRALPVTVPQVVAIQFGTADGGQRSAVVVEQFTFTCLAIGGGHAGDQRVGQLAAGVAARYGLPVQTGPPRRCGNRCFRDVRHRA